MERVGDGSGDRVEAGVGLALHRFVGFSGRFKEERNRHTHGWDGMGLLALDLGGDRLDTPEFVLL